MMLAAVGVYLVTGALLSTAVSACPSQCSCFYHVLSDGSKARSVICNDPDTSAVPSGFPVDTSKLRIEKTSVQAIPGEAFSYLSGLEFLWMSFNALSSLHADSFRGLVSLEELRLDGNDLAWFPWDGLADMPALRLLDLHNNRLSALPDDVHAYVTNLTYLDLSSNLLLTLPAEVISSWLAVRPTQPAPALGLVESSKMILGLHDNPWVCDCRLYELVQFQRSPSLSVAFIDTRLRCSAPESLSGVLFSDAELRRCQLPRVHTAVARVRSIAGNNVLLRCGTIGVPVPDMAWRRADGRPLNGTVQQETSKEGITWSILRLPTVSLRDSGRYVCMAANYAGNAEAVVSLMVSNTSRPVGNLTGTDRKPKVKKSNPQAAYQERLAARYVAPASTPGPPPGPGPTVAILPLESGPPASPVLASLALEPEPLSDSNPGTVLVKLALDPGSLPVSSPGPGLANMALEPDPSPGSGGTGPGLASLAKEPASPTGSGPGPGLASFALEPDPLPGSGPRPGLANLALEPDPSPGLGGTGPGSASLAKEPVSPTSSGPEPALASLPMMEPVPPPGSGPVPGLASYSLADRIDPRGPAPTTSPDAALLELEKTNLSSLAANASSLQQQQDPDRVVRSVKVVGDTDNTIALNWRAPLAKNTTAFMVLYAVFGQRDMRKINVGAGQNRVTINGLVPQTKYIACVCVRGLIPKKEQCVIFSTDVAASATSMQRLINVIVITVACIIAVPLTCIVCCGWLKRRLARAKKSKNIQDSYVTFEALSSPVANANKAIGLEDDDFLTRLNPEESNRLLSARSSLDSEPTAARIDGQPNEYFC